MTLPKYTRDQLPSDGWHQYTRRRGVVAVRIDGPFIVVTREGELTCTDGYLALDINDDPYPIATDVMDATYDTAGD